MKELLALSLTGIVIMLADIFNARKLSFPIALLGLATTLASCILDWGVGEDVYHMMKLDNFALAFTSVLCVVGVMWLLMSVKYFDTMRDATDRYALFFFILTGALVMVSFTNLTMLFIGVEILSISAYALAGSSKKDLASNESALKYFLMGAFASGFLLLGIAFVYGAFGSFDLQTIRGAKVTLANKSFLQFGILGLIVGLGFKTAAAPFHFWAPDVYQGAPMPITALMATVVKIAAIAAFYRLFVMCFVGSQSMWIDIVAILLVLSLLVGNVTAVMQNDAKRMLAFSSISHAGYLMFAILCMGGSSEKGLLFYTLSYSIATLVAFTVLFQVSNATGSTSISSFNGLGKTQPVKAFFMSLALLSMAGIPPLGGFMAKYFLFANAISQGYVGLVVFAVVMSLVGIFYYFKILMAMYGATDEAVEVQKQEYDPMQDIMLWFGSALLLVLGLFPTFVYQLL